MEIKQKLKNLVSIVSRHKLASAVVVGLAGLVAVTSLKDNVHFGAVRLHNPQGNHYAWGILPTIGIEGEKDENVKGDFYSIGLIGGANNVEPNSTIIGNIGAYGLIGGANNFGLNSKITGNMGAYGLLVGVNNVEPNSTIIGNIGAYGLLVGANNFGPNSTIIGNMGAYGLIFGENNVEPNSKITGDVVSRGIIATSPKGRRVGTNVEIDLENYVVSNKNLDAKVEEEK